MASPAMATPDRLAIERRVAIMQRCFPTPQAGAFDGVVIA
jgi:hypothetical protein